MNQVLRDAMIAAGLTAETLAELAEVDPKSAQRWVARGRIPRPRARAIVAEALGKDVGELWPDVLRRREPTWFKPWQELEKDAVALLWFEPAYIPGLLQTEPYARLTLAGERLTKDETDRIVAGRLKRQVVLTGERPPLLVAVLDQTVVRKLAAHPDRALVKEQVERIERAVEEPHVAVHVVPDAVGPHPGMGGAFTLADLSDGSRVVHVDGQLAAQILSDASEIDTLNSRWERIRSVALPGPESMAVIRGAIT